MSEKSDIDMIYSDDKQHGVSSAQLVKLQDALAVVKVRASDQAWLKSQIAEIEAELDATS